MRHIGIAIGVTSTLYTGNDQGLEIATKDVFYDGFYVLAISGSLTRGGLAISIGRMKNRKII